MNPQQSPGTTNDNQQTPPQTFVSGVSDQYDQASQSSPQALSTLQPLNSQHYQENPPSYAADYLDQIAPEGQKAENRMAVLGLVAGVLVLVIAAFFVISGLQPPSFAKVAYPLQARIETLQVATKQQTGRLTDAIVNDTNASLNSALKSMSSDFDTITTTKKLKKNNDKKFKNKEAAYSAALTEGLEKDYARGLLDRTYTTKIVYELTELKRLIKNLSVATKDKDTAAFIETSTKNIDATLKILNNFSASKS